MNASRNTHRVPGRLLRRPPVRACRSAAVSSDQAWFSS